MMIDYKSQQRNDRLAQCAGSHSVLYKTTPAQLAPRGGVRGEDVSGIICCRWCRGSAGEQACFSYRPAHCTMRWAAPILPDKSGKKRSRTTTRNLCERDEHQPPSGAVRRPCHAAVEKKEHHRHCHRQKQQSPVVERQNAMPGPLTPHTRPLLLWFGPSYACQGAAVRLCRAEECGTL